MHYQIAHRDGGKMRALILRPALAAIDTDPQSELCTQEEETRIHNVFLDHVRIAARARLTGRKRGPGLAEIACPINVRLHIAIHVEVKRRIRRRL